MEGGKKGRRWNVERTRNQSNTLSLAVSPQGRWGVGEGGGVMGGGLGLQWRKQLPEVTPFSFFPPPEATDCVTEK